LTTTLLQAVPTDGKTLETLAGLPTSDARSALTIALQTVRAATRFPVASDIAPTQIDEMSLGIVTSAQSVLVFDRASGKVLFEKDPSAVRAIGSITKLMTALVFLETSPVLAAQAALEEMDVREGGKLYLTLNDAVTIEDILSASLIGSDNSATMALVRLSGMDEVSFVARMNALAGELEMIDTQFEEPTGLSPHNRSTAYDLTHLLSRALSDERIRTMTTTPQVSITQASGRVAIIDSTDALLETFVNQDPFTMLGGKTGYLPEAGYCIALGVQKAGEGEVFVVLLGSDSSTTRVQEVKGLVDWVYRVWDWE
jgi:D-alanyl-D-alanine carboxypeptidase/D-alanyl-D-alanine endopeptidase (penicillin-binding protein 7)